MRYEAKVKEVLQETPDVKLVRLVWDGISKFGFKPGQWIGAYCDDFLAENNKPLRRAFSIASMPGDPYLELCITRGKHLSAHLQDLPPESKVHIDGPFGMFWLRPAEKYLFLAAGTGIAPFIPMIDQALREEKEVLLLYSFKTPSDFIYQKQLEGIDNKNFKMITSVTRGDFPAWEGETGRIQTFLEKYYKEGYLAYICGPEGMVEATENKLVELGQPKDHIFIDKWE
jgi:ferredoxin-NADP reductase